MRRRLRPTKDSLDLLLDTMCNAFGGIVLIALLVAILIEKPGDESSKASASGKESLEKLRKVRELQELEEDLNELQTRWEENRELIELVEERDRLARILSNQQKTAALSVVQLNERRRKAAEERTKMLEDLSRLQREVASLESRILDKREAVESLEDEMEELVTSRMSETRPPELRDAGGQQVNLILRHGEIFPVSFIEFYESGEIRSISSNETSLLWRGADARPIRGKGWDVEGDLDRFRGFINGIRQHNKLYAARPSQRMHIAMFVYGDSFSHINTLFGIIDEEGNIARGWEPWEKDRNLAFSADGEKSQVE